MSYLISVVVPTKNRYCYLKYLIKLIDSFKLDELEFVIQDNSDNNQEILDYLKEFDNPNIKYYYSSDKLTMSGNSDLAILNSTGEYVCFIGDDDGVCRNIVDCVRWMKRNNVEAAYSNVVCYHWKGRVKLFPRKNRSTVSIRNVNHERSRLLKHGFGLSSTNMPLVYHAIVLKDKLLQVYNQFGTFSPGCPPDIAGSIALSFYVEKYCELNIPVIINGSSAMTGGGVIKEGGVLPLDKVPFISKEDIANWDRRLPPVWCGHYAWANAGIHTLQKMNKESLLKCWNKNYCLAAAVATRPWRKDLIHYSFEYSNNKLGLFLLIIYLLAKRVIRKCINDLTSVNSNNIETIISAEEFCVSYTKRLL